MDRAKRIASRGWLGTALNVATFGYYPVEPAAVIGIGMTLTPRQRTFTVAARHTMTLIKRRLTFNLDDRD
jgi:hypothetical protein